MSEANLPPLISNAKAAKRLGVSRWTVERMCRDGEIPSTRPRGVRRIDPVDVENWIADEKAKSMQRGRERVAAGEVVARPARRGRGRPRKAGVGKAERSRGVQATE